MGVFRKLRGAKCFDAKGETQEAETSSVRVPMQSNWADQLVVALKAGNAAGAKGVKPFSIALFF